MANDIAADADRDGEMSALGSFNKDWSLVALQREKLKESGDVFALQLDNIH